ncbi:Protein of unknown function [Gryllus bimaculatus]|nr:Protein of unknown function [Gryllus bimaculatus]
MGKRYDSMAAPVVRAVRRRGAQLLCGRAREYLPLPLDFPEGNARAMRGTNVAEGGGLHLSCAGCPLDDGRSDDEMMEISIEPVNEF